MKCDHNRSLRSISNDNIHYKLSILGIRLTFGKWLEVGEVLIRKIDVIATICCPTYTRNYNSYHYRNKKLCYDSNFKKSNSLRRCAIHHTPLSVMSTSTRVIIK